jgi:hypothetical protein
MKHWISQEDLKMKSARYVSVVIFTLIVAIGAMQGFAVATEAADANVAFGPEVSRPDWTSIKANAMPHVALPDEYGMPYIQANNTLGWEDGLFISRDGLHLYAFYAPLDMFKYIAFVAVNPGCREVEEIRPFFRGPRMTMDFKTNPWGCPIVIHSDIAYSTRSSVSEDFGRWQIARISNPASYDGGFHSIANQDGTIDIVYSRSMGASQNDLFWARGVKHNPPFGVDIPMPAPINTMEQEDNPQLERLDADTLLLIFDNHGQDDPVTRIKYSMSHDNGETWDAPRYFGEPINSGSHDMHGHYWRDVDDQWLYFVSDRNGLLSIFRSKHLDGEKFDNWGVPELVIAPGVIEDNSGFMAGVGEPTLAANGDISFTVVYCAHEDDHPYDRCDIDAWMLPRKP